MTIPDIFLKRKCPFRLKNTSVFLSLDSLDDNRVHIHKCLLCNPHSKTKDWKTCKLCIFD